jgi:hypothetical protein
MECLQHDKEDAAINVCGALVEIASTTPKLMRTVLPAVVAAMLQVAHYEVRMAGRARGLAGANARPGGFAGRGR